MDLKEATYDGSIKTCLPKVNCLFSFDSFYLKIKSYTEHNTVKKLITVMFIISLLTITSMMSVTANERTFESKLDTDSGPVIYRSNVDADQRDQDSITHRNNRKAAPSFKIVYDNEFREIHIYAKEDQLTQGTAILIESDSYTNTSPVIRINLVTDDPGTDGKLAISLDVPLYSEVYGLQNSFDSMLMVTEIWYHGGSERDEFSNYTDVPLHASGSYGDDFFLGGGGPDQLYGGSGNDEIRGGGGDDELYGYDGNDVLSGNDGHDIIHGYYGDDILYGNNGNDELFPGGGSDNSYGGNGDDFIEEFSPQGPDTNLICGNDGADILMGAWGGGTISMIDGENSAGEGANDGDPDILYGYDADTFEFDIETTQIFIGLDQVQIFPGEYGFPYSDFISCGN